MNLGQTSNETRRNRRAVVATFFLDTQHLRALLAPYVGVLAITVFIEIRSADGVMHE